MSKEKETKENPMEKVQSHDWNKERLEQLKQLMPDLFTNDGTLNINELKKVVDPKSVNETERYEFRWFGKSNAKREAFTPTDATLVYDEARSVNPTESENLIIEGENLAVLKLLSNSYREQVKCIYIDPPYNKDKDFVYSDTWKQDRKEYWEDAEMVENGLKIDTNIESSGRYHSNWLNMMYSRLLIARSLLKPEGVIFISISDEEIHHLRKLCDEVFGEENFEGHIHWRRRHNQPNDKSKMIGIVAEHILSYSKNKEEYKKAGVGKVDLTGDFSNPDNDPRGDWASKPWKVGSDQSGSKYVIVNPNNGVEYDGEWMGEKTTYENLLEDNRIVFPKNGDGFPRKKYFRFEREEEGQCATNWWSHKQFGHNQGANDEMTSLFGEKNIFSNPKPKELIRGLIQISNAKSGDIVLDFFGGSGVTGQATMEMNEEDKQDRKFIVVQLPEKIAEAEEAYKAGYKKISDITIERNKRVIEKIIKEKKEAQPDLFSKKENEQEQLKGLGFKVFKLKKSNFPRVEYAPDPEKSEEENIELLKKYIRDKEAQLVTAFNRDELITEILIKNGFKLNYTLAKQENFKKNEILLATDGDKETLICLDVTIADETVEYFKTHTDQKLIVLERALDTTKKWNLKHAMGDKFNAF
ncbi:MAG: site-specific DNA-methyltransferase [Chitinophagales bacterium]|nr:site-specific DNA-methyltransferase [Chitinophagales bacterium]